MIKMRKVSILLLLAFFSLLTIQISLAAPSTPPIVYVAGDGSGDYNTDGVADQVQINQALKFVAENDGYTTVYLKGPNTYVIDDTIFIGSNTILEGDSDAVVKLVDHADWEKYRSMICTIGNPGQAPTYVPTYNIIIRGFEIDGNRANNEDWDSALGKNRYSGSHWYHMIYLINAYGVEIYDMNLHNNMMDAISMRHTGVSQHKFVDVYSKFYNNTIYDTGHDAIYIFNCDNVEVYNNDIITRTNAGVRTYNAKNILIRDNSIKGGNEGGGGAGIQIGKTGAPLVTDIEIRDNVISGTTLSGIWVYGHGTYDFSTAKGVYIHNNLIYDTGASSGDRTSGIAVQGFSGTLIENNIIDDNNKDAISHRVFSPIGTPPNSGYKTIVRNNIITSTKPHWNEPSTTGYGLNNDLSSTHSFISENNIMYNNANGDYRYSSSTKDIHADPMFVDPENRDYRLKSNSPFIDSGIGLTDSISNDDPTSPINNAPVFSPIGTKSVDETDSLTFPVSATDADGDSLTYSASGLPSGANFDAASGMFTWTPAKGQAGTYTVMFEVTDGALTDSQNVNIVVNSMQEVYDNRLRQSSPDSNLAGNTYLDVGNIEGVGSYRDVIWFDLSDYNSTDVVDKATLSLFWYYENGARSSDTVVEIYKPLDWTPSSVTWNSPWIIAGGDWVDSRGVPQGSVPYDSIVFSSTSSPDNRYYEFDVTELVQDYVSGNSKNNGFFIKARDEGNNYIAFYSSDWSNANQRPVLNIDHRISGGISGGDGGVELNEAPVLSPIGPKNVAETDKLTIDASATDSNGDSLTYSATGMPSGATIDPVTGVFEWTPSIGQEGAYEVTLKVSDGYLSDSELVTITVSKVAHKPVITSLQPLDNSVFEEGDVISISVDAYDEDGDPLNYIVKVDGVIRSTSASYDWVTDLSSEGTHTIEVIVSDGANQATAQCSITINEAGLSFDPMVYDTDSDGSLSKKEVYAAIDDYYGGTLTRKEINRVVYEYFK